jgi:hypothetical protein
MVGGSNFGELLGALTVALSKNYVPTPLPWLRLDALLLQIVWVLPFIPVKRYSVVSAWRVAACFLPICKRLDNPTFGSLTDYMDHSLWVGRR